MYLLLRSGLYEHMSTMMPLRVSAAHRLRTPRVQVGVVLVLARVKPRVEGQGELEAGLGIVLGIQRSVFHLRLLTHRGAASLSHRMR